MSVRSRLDVEKGLLSKGFLPTQNDHRRFTYWDLEGKKTQIRTKISHGHSGSDIGDSLLSRMATQCNLNKAKFLKLLDCDLDREEFEKIAL